MRATGPADQEGSEPPPLICHLTFAFFLLTADGSAAQPAADCARYAKPHLLVRIRGHQLLLCDMGEPVKSFSVRLARNGAGKTKSGDGKLPVGTYSVGSPRPSKLYGTFVPIGYPTSGQAARGLTGGGVGVHGPDRRARWLGSLVNLFDTTDGCVGLASDDDMEAVAHWIIRVHRSV